MKIKLTESQYSRLESYINEASQDKFRVDVEFTVRPSITARKSGGLTYNGKEIFDINSITIPVTFNIEIEYRTGGIKSIFIGNFSGLSEHELELEYEDGETSMVTIKLDWGGVLATSETDKGVITIDSSGYINLINDNEGFLSVESIELTKYEL